MGSRTVSESTLLFTIKSVELNFVFFSACEIMKKVFVFKQFIDYSMQNRVYLSQIYEYDCRFAYFPYHQMLRFSCTFNSIYTRNIKPTQQKQRLVFPCLCFVHY